MSFLSLRYYVYVIAHFSRLLSQLNLLQHVRVSEALRLHNEGVWPAASFWLELKFPKFFSLFFPP